MDTNAIVVEQTFNAPVAVVWTAITDPDQMRQWFFEPIVDFKPETGFETQFNVRCEDRDFLHVWKVTDVVPKKRIAYSWRYEGYPGDSTVVWELSESANGTKLLFTHVGHETFPQDDPIFSRESGQAGWDYLVGESLPAFLQRQSSQPKD
ncbi:MAG: SRPBCC domain-containing protein [Planctomycetes bacterium]|nr:SRPBCC domain-containing protein [Planctomycetota bacterium]MBL7038945.1 SRPBCC domain-containing protein [Pirellulaceae bacterium]